MKHRINLLLALGLLFCVMTVQAQNQTSKPTLTCTVTNCLTGGNASTDPSVFNVANGDLISIDAVLTGVGFPEGSHGTAAINPSILPSDTYFYTVQVFQEPNDVEIPVTTFYTGGGGNDIVPTETLSFDIEIPDTKAVRLAKAQNFLDQTVALANASGQQNSTAMIYINTHRDQVINMLEDQLQENRLGYFKIICTFISKRPGMWNGEVKSKPVMIDVLDTGTGLDKLLAQSAQAAANLTANTTAAPQAATAANVTLPVTTSETPAPPSANPLNASAATSSPALATNSSNVLTPPQSTPSPNPPVAESSHIIGFLAVGILVLLAVILWLLRRK